MKSMESTKKKERKNEMRETKMTISVKETERRKRKKSSTYND